MDRALVDQLGALLQAAPSSRGNELRAQLAFTHGDRQLALAEAERALTLAGTDPAAHAAALVRRAWVLLAGDGSEQGQTRHLDEAIALARRAGDAAKEARAWQQSPPWPCRRASRPRPRRITPAPRSCGRAWATAGRRRHGCAAARKCLIELGELGTALAWISASQRLAEAEGDGVGQLDAAYSLAQAHAAGRDWPGALAAARQALRIAHQRQHLRTLTLQLFGHPLAHLRQPEPALQLAAFAERYWRQHLGALTGREARALARLRRLAQAHLGRERSAAAWASGQTLNLGEALALAQG